VKQAQNVSNFQSINFGRHRAAVLGSNKVANHEQNTITRQRLEGSIWSTAKEQDHVIPLEQQGVNVKFQERAAGVLRDRAAELPHLEGRGDITLNCLERYDGSSCKRHTSRGIHRETGVHYFAPDDHLRFGDCLMHCGRRYSFALHLDHWQRPRISVPPNKVPQECGVALVGRINNFLFLGVSQPSPGIDSNPFLDERQRRIASLRNNRAYRKNCDEGSPGDEQPTPRQSRCRGDRGEYPCADTWPRRRCPRRLVEFGLERVSQPSFVKFRHWKFLLFRNL
jgi:hypothetical protein